MSPRDRTRDPVVKRSERIATFVLLLVCSMTAHGTTPNFVVLLVDDAALMDFGAYGGEASTPNIDQLAARGVKFSSYHTSPMCAPSRAMLLTGMDSHRTGVATLPEAISKEQKGAPGYALHLLDGVDTIGARLREQGYQTFMTGKWHLGEASEHLPDQHGFDRSFALAASGADNWEQKSFLPFYEDAPWYEDGAPATLPADFYSSRFLVEKMVEYLDNRDSERPFLSYIAFQAIHIPVQAPAEFTANYDGVYADGWDALRIERLNKAKQLGLIPPEAPPPLPLPSSRPWDELSEAEQRHYEASMMVNAGMLEAMDHYIGELVAYLQQEGELANTVFVVTSDNGPEPGDPAMDQGFRLWMRANDYHTSLEHAGETGYMGAIGQEWASAAATPGSLFKMYASEGGTRVPLIMSGPGVTPQENFNHALTFVTDVAPTILDIAGFEIDDMDGKSLKPLLENTESAVYHENESVGMEMAYNASVFRGNYKLTRNALPMGDGEWRLHNLAEDPAEQTDLSAELPELRHQMLLDYANYRAEVGVIELPGDFDLQAQINSNVLTRLAARNLPIIGSVLLFVFLAIIYVVRRRA